MEVPSTATPTSRRRTLSATPPSPAAGTTSSSLSFARPRRSTHKEDPSLSETVPGSSTAPVSPPLTLRRSKRVAPPAREKRSHSPQDHQETTSKRRRSTYSGRSSPAVTAPTHSRKRKASTTPPSNPEPNTESTSMPNRGKGKRRGSSDSDKNQEEPREERKTASAKRRERRQGEPEADKDDLASGSVPVPAPVPRSSRRRSRGQRSRPSEATEPLDGALEDEHDDEEEASPSNEPNPEPTAEKAVEKEEEDEDDDDDDDEEEEDDEEGGGTTTDSELRGFSASGLTPSQLETLLGMSGITVMRGGNAQSSTGSGMSPRFQAMLSQMKNRGNPTAQLIALQELAEVLSMATEDMFSMHGGSRSLGLNATEFLKALLEILSPGSGDFPIEFMDDFAFDDGGGLNMNPEIMLLACRCLFNFIEALPAATSIILQQGGIPILVGKLTEIEYIDLAEQVLSTLKKLTQDYPLAIIKANGLMAVLQYIDFFSLHVQRTAVTVAADACHGLNSVSLNPSVNDGNTSIVTQVAEVVPILERLITYSDARIVEQSVRALGTICEWCWRYESHLERLVQKSLLEAVFALVKPALAPSPGETSLISAPIFTQLLKMLSTIARGSPKLSIVLVNDLKALDLIATYFLGQTLDEFIDSSLDQTSNSATAITQSVVNKPLDQIMEVLSLTQEMLPGIPEGVLWEGLPASPNSSEQTATPTGQSPSRRGPAQSPQEERDAKRLELLKSHPDILKHYVEGLVPILIKVFGATGNHGLRKKTVECIGRAVWHCIEHDTARAFVKCLAQPGLGFGRFISELLALNEVVCQSALSPSSPSIPFSVSAASERDRREALSQLSAGLQIARFVLTKEPQAFQSLFAREGVFDQIAKCTSSAEEGLKIIATEEIQRMARISSISSTAANAGSETVSREPSQRPADGESAHLSGLVATLRSVREQLGSRPDASTEQIERLQELLRTARELSRRAGLGLDDGLFDIPNTAAPPASAEQPSPGTADTATQAGAAASDAPPSTGVSTAQPNRDSSSPSRGVFSRLGLGMGSSLSGGYVTSITGEKRTEKEVYEWISISSQKLLSERTTEPKATDHSTVLADLQRLATALLDADVGNDPSRLEPLQAIGRHLNGSSKADLEAGITSYELLESKILPALITFLTAPGPEDLADDQMAVPMPTSVLTRIKAFIHVFMNGPSPSLHGASRYISGALAVLLRLLDECLSRVERFDVAPAVPYGGDTALGFLFSGARSVMRDAPASQLARQIRLRLVAEDGQSVPSHYATFLVSVHAIATFRALEDFLKTKIGPASSSAEPASSSAEPARRPSGASGSASASQPAPESQGTAANVTTASSTSQTAETTNPTEEKVADSASPKQDLVEQKALANDNQEEEEDEEAEEEDDEVDDDDTSDVDGEDDEEDVGDILLRAEARQRHRRRNSGGSHISSASEAPLPPSGQGSPSGRGEAANISLSPERQPASTSQASKPRPSYAQVAKEGDPSKDKSRPKKDGFQFTMDDVPIARDHTIFGVMYRYEQEKKAAAAGSAKPLNVNVWSNAYTIKFKRLTADEREAQRNLEREQHKKDLEARRPVYQDQLFRVRLPFHVKGENTGSNDPALTILELLRLLYGINERFGQVLLQEVDSESSLPLAAAAEGPKNRASALSASSAAQLYSAVITAPGTLFTSTKLTAKLNRQLSEPLVVASNVLPPWCPRLVREYRFLVPFETRLQYLQSTSFGYSRSLSRWQQQSAQNRASSGRGLSSDGALGQVGRIPRQKVRVHRDRIIESMMKVMDMYGSTQALLEIEFFDEVGTGLGPTQEFYSLVCRTVRLREGPFLRINSSSFQHVKLWRSDDAIVPQPSGIKKSDLALVNDALAYLNPPNGLFPSPMTHSVTHSEVGRRTLSLYKSLGTLVAKGLLDSRIIDLPLNPLFIQLLLKDVTVAGIANGGLLSALQHIKVVDSGLFSSMSDLMLYLDAKRAIDADASLSVADKKTAYEEVTVRGGKLSDLCLDFTLPGYPDIPLCPNGADVTVTMDNLEAYLNAIVNTTVGDGVRHQVDAFRRGFDKVFPMSDLECFNVDEIGILLGSHAEEDWSVATLLEAIRADHGFNQGSRVIGWLVEMMSELSPPDRREFLQFVTGSPKLPLGGFKALVPPLTVVCKTMDSSSHKPNDYLPSVNTCMNYLKVPEYSDKPVLVNKFRLAIGEGQGSFHLS